MAEDATSTEGLEMLDDERKAMDGLETSGDGGGETATIEAATIVDGGVACLRFFFPILASPLSASLLALSSGKMADDAGAGPCEAVGAGKEAACVAGAETWTGTGGADSGETIRTSDTPILLFFPLGSLGASTSELPCCGPLHSGLLVEATGLETETATGDAKEWLEGITFFVLPLMPFLGTTAAAAIPTLTTSASRGTSRGCDVLSTLPGLLRQAFFLAGLRDEKTAASTAADRFAFIGRPQSTQTFHQAN